MNLDEAWDTALKQTEVIRMRAQELNTFSPTTLPYLFLGESTVNAGDTVARRGRVVVERPDIILPQASPHFEGFELDDSFHVGEDTLINFLLVRGVAFPSLKYQQETTSLDLLEKSLNDSIKMYKDQLERAEDVQTGFLVGPEECWQLSIVIMVGMSVTQSAQGDLRRITERWQSEQRN